MKSTKEKSSFLSWITTHPKKFVISVLLIVLPIFIILLVYLNFSKNANKFHFSTGDTNIEYIYQKNLTSKKKLEKYMDLNITLVETKHLNQGGKHYDNSQYKFKFKYVPTSVYKSSTFSFEVILSSSWVKEQTTKESISLTAGTTSERTIRYPYDTPERKLLLFKVGLPSLYFKITIDYVSTGVELGGESIVLYYRYDLNKINYQYNAEKPISK